MLWSDYLIRTTWTRVILVVLLCVLSSTQFVFAQTNGTSSDTPGYVPPIPAPPTLPPSPTPELPDLPSVPPIAPPTVPPFPVPAPTPVPPGLPVPPLLPPPPSLPTIPLPPPPTPPPPTPTPAAQAFISVWTEGSVTPITSGIRIIAADENVEQLEWFSANATTCETDGFTTTSVLSGTITAPDARLLLSPGESRTYALRCRNTAGVWSSWREVTIIKQTATTAPTDTAPEAPVIRGADMSTSPAVSAPTGFTVPFTIRATDADNDTLRYLIDWNQDSEIDQIVPDGTYVPSGTPVATSRVWTVVGVYQFAVRTEDSTGRVSAWTPHTITIDTPPAVAPVPPTMTLTVSKDFVRTGDFVTVSLTVSASYPVSCVLYGVNGGTYSVVYPGGIGLETYTRNTAPLTATQLVRGVCTPITPGFTLPDQVREARVGVVPTIEEI